jgi:hypothetical protein
MGFDEQIKGRDRIGFGLSLSDITDRGLGLWLRQFRCLMLLCSSMRGLCAVGHTKFAIDFADNIAFQAPSEEL